MVGNKPSSIGCRVRCAWVATTTVSVCASYGFLVTEGTLTRHSNPHSQHQQHRGSKTTAEYLPQPLDGNESSTCGSSASPSRCNSAAGMQHQQWQEDGQGSRLLSPSDTAYQVSSHAVGRSNNNIDNPQDEGLCSDDAMLESDGGSSSREDYFDTASSSYETEDTGSMYSDEDGSSITTRSRQQDFGGYRDTMNHHSNSAGHSIPTATPSQHPSLGRHHTSHPFFNAHLSRHHLDANHAARNGEDSHRRTSTAGDSFVPGRLATGTAFAAAVVAVVAPLGQALSSHWPYFVAGGICAAVSHTAAVPLDVLKTRIQTAEPGEYRGTWDALVSICRSEGGQVLFGGAGATLVGYAMQGCLKFGFFEFLKPLFSTLFVGSSSPVLSSLIAASVAAEMVGSSALTPLEAARIRMVSDSSYAPGLRAGIARMIDEEGVAALTRGLPAVMAKQIPYTVTKLVSFDILTRFAKNSWGLSGSWSTVWCAVVAGMLSSLASQPGDSMLSTLNSERRRTGDDQDRREPVGVAMARIARTAGFGGLFKGTPARMLHVTTIVTVQLFIYQSVKNMVGIGG